MPELTLQIPDTLLSTLQMEPDEFLQEMRLAMALRVYDRQRISQAEAAEIAGLSRADFVIALSLAKVPLSILKPSHLPEEWYGIP